MKRHNGRCSAGSRPFAILEVLIDVVDVLFVHTLV